MNIITNKRIIIAIIGILVALPVTARDCSKAVERIINGWANAAKRIQACQTQQEFTSLDHEEIAGNIDLGEIASQCGDYVLSASEKRRMIKAYENLLNVTIDKMQALFYPDIPIETLREAMKPNLNVYTQLVLEAHTLGDWIKVNVAYNGVLTGKNESSKLNNTSKSPKANTKENSSSRKLKVSDIKDLEETLPPEGSNTYYAKNMFDGKSSTGWAVSLDNFYGCCDRRWGPEFSINARRIDYIKILNGYAKSQTAYLNNTRANWILIYRVNENDEDDEFIDEKDIIYAGPLKDVNEFQKLKVDPQFDNTKPTKRVGLVFSCGDDGFYLGKKYSDLVVSELEFYGEPQ